ncbi:hypothetical protein GCM10011351_14470 [Paraliobacillus quinghaiensis]|uniref:SHOCT domain-containing protein n=1 Tax=Paraliobacillus quinghaiensis TaxID=470815 RepID=A0A917WU37_9BACI|nr:SHOCT domain-containing protein [Paraliobacillus quinghaiensis]GGM29465.1 hypothetical protein GCM10011351_14470 [Paraliobacillus quinghaiensis]
MMNGSGMGGGFFGFGFFSIFIIIAIVAVIFWMFNNRGTSSSHNRTESNSFEILKRRLANGEISEEEYERLKKKLQE